MKGRQLQHESGFTLVELVISAVVVTIIVLATAEMFAVNTLSLSLGRARASGLSLANERMEYLRDLPYDSLATQYGAIYPAGNVQDDQNFTRDNIKLKVHTEINYVDDPYDGNADGTIPSKPTDYYSYDYKKVEITVYTQNGNRQVAKLTTNVAAKAAETSSNTGILRIKVLDANGQPVQDADVHITNTVPNPDVNINTNTDSNGLVVIPKLPPDSGGNYKIVVTKAGYSTDQTYADPSGSQTAVLVNPNVLVQQISNVTFSIDRLASAGVNVVDTSGNPVSGLTLGITGAKQIYNNPAVYKYNQSKTTNPSGQVDLTSLEWDSYSFTPPSGYYIVSTSPYQPTVINPNDSASIKIVVSTSSSWPRITTVAPTSDTNDAATSLVLTGVNLGSGTTIKLTKSGQSDLNPTSNTITSTSITASFNIAGAATGPWDIVITKSGQTTTQYGGFNVTAP